MQQQFPEIDGRNYKKVLRELDISKYPSLPDYLKDIHLKLRRKQELTVSEEVLTKSKLITYFKDLKFEYNKFYFDKFDWNTVDHRKPKPFQLDGIKFLTLNDRCILADDMGLGKSLQTVIATKVQPEEFNILIITLKSLKKNFANEIKFFDERISIIDKKWEPNKYTIIHYDNIKKFQKEILECRFEILILDEAHKLKSNKSKRAEKFFDILNETKKDLQKVWLLTGTPIANRPIEYFNLLRIIKHPLSKNWQEYVVKYCNGFQDAIYNRWVVNGASNLLDLHNQTKSSVLRRLKKDVLKDLPDKMRVPLYLELENKKGYRKALKDFADKKYQLEGIKDTELNEMTKIAVWRQFCALEKLNDGSLVELIENEIDKGNKIIVFTNFTKVVDEIYKIFGSKICRTLDGRTKDRQEVVDEFNANENLKVFVINIKIGAAGWNIQSANSVIVNDLPWVPDDLVQCEDRAWRMGQNREVVIHFPLYAETIEEHMLEIILSKVKITTQVIDGVQKDFLDNDQINSDLKKIEEDSRLSLVQEIFKKINMATV